MAMVNKMAPIAKTTNSSINVYPSRLICSALAKFYCVAVGLLIEAKQNVFIQFLTVVVAKSVCKSRTSTIILGAGVSGMSVALKLLLCGHRVAVLDRGKVGGESSWAGGGILSPLLPWEYAEAVIRLTLRSMASFPHWIKTLEAKSGLSTEFWPCGMKVLGYTVNDSALDWCKRQGLSATHTNEGLWLADIAQVRNPRLIEALRVAVLRLGGTIHTTCEVDGVTRSGERLTAMLTSSGTFTADQYVLATGAWSSTFLPQRESFQSGLIGSPNIRPIRGQMLLYKLAPGALNTIVYRHGIYLIPRRDGHVLVGSTLEDVGFDKSTDMATRQRLHAEAAKLWPILNTVQPVQHWAGLRPGSPDNIPIIDRHPDFDNVFVNTGHYRYGVTMAPASAELLVDLMEGKTPALDPEPYRWQAALSRSWGDKL